MVLQMLQDLIIRTSWISSLFLTQILINHNLHRSTSVIDSLRMAIGRADGHRTQNIIKQLSNNLHHMGGGMKVRGWRLII